MGKSVLVTGSAGFIGMHVSLALLDQAYEVVGLDNLNSYYDTTLKKNRLNLMENEGNFQMAELDLVDPGALEDLDQGG